MLKSDWKQTPTIRKATTTTAHSTIHLGLFNSLHLPLFSQSTSLSIIHTILLHPLPLPLLNPLHKPLNRTTPQSKFPRKAQTPLRPHHPRPPKLRPPLHTLPILHQLRNNRHQRQAREPTELNRRLRVSWPNTDAAFAGPER